MPAKFEILSGWKEIANYLGKGVRTVQRYERELGLPVHRPAGKPAGSVIAAKAELDAWVKAGPVHVKRWPTERTNKLGAEFPQIDSEIALTFTSLALAARNNETRRRTTETARKAYNAIMRLRKSIKLTDAQSVQLDTNLQRLKSELQRLGHRVTSSPGD